MSVQRLRRLDCWLPAVAWMTLIFIGSTGVLSAPRTSRLIGPFLHWLIPGIADGTVDAVVFATRKCAHAGEYGLLALLVLGGLNQSFRFTRRAWDARRAGQALIVAAAYAVTDEIHQAFVPSRHGDPLDVLLDGAGATAALLGAWWWHRRRRKPTGGPE